MLEMSQRKMRNRMIYGAQNVDDFETKYKNASLGKRNNWLSSSNRNNFAIYLSSSVWSTRRLSFYESASIHLAMNKKEFKSIDCKMLIMCHICGHIKRELFTRLSRNLVAAWK